MKSSASELWAITSYFNPLGYRRRRQNFRVFRERLAVPLIVVELAYGGGFELDENDAEILIRRRGSDIIWQKERLLNLALAALPNACSKVVWIDCDVVFPHARWLDDVVRLLEEYPVVQAFARVHHVDRDAACGEDAPAVIDFSQWSITSVISAGEIPSEALGRALMRGPTNPANGFAWGARRKVLDAHGLYDACIIGGGDTAFACAAYGCFEAAARLHAMNPYQRDRYVEWAGPLYADIRGAVGRTEAHLFHLWHGEQANRRARERHARISGLGFDPTTDIVIDDGCWRWATDKPALHAYVRDYFYGRREDG